MAVQTAFDFAARPAPHPAPAADPVRAAPVRPVASAQACGVGESREADRSRGLLERRLGELLERPVMLTLTDNGRTMISSRRRGEIEHVRLHHMFVEADEPIVVALGAFLGHGDKRAAQHLEHYVAKRRSRIRTRTRRRDPLCADGTHHDLVRIFDYLNTRYFGDRVDAEIGWARRTSAPRGKKRRHSIKLGSYRQADSSIRIHPVLDGAWVPEFFVEYVIYHEMLHHVIGIAVEGGRRQMHTPEFRARERGYARYEEAMAWERENLQRLLSG